LKTTNYLFGDDIDIHIIMLQKDIAAYKINKAKKLLTELQTIDLANRDDKRINDVLKAINFWTQILQEEI